MRIPEVLAKQLADLEKYAGKDGILEVVIRRKDKKIADILKVGLQDLKPQGQEEVLKAIKAGNAELAGIIKQGNGELANMIAQGNALAKFASVASCIGAAASIVNIGVTIAGFAMMAEKLNALDSKVVTLLSEVHDIKEFHIEEFRREYHGIVLKSKKYLDFYSRGMMQSIKHDDLDAFLNQYCEYLTSVLRLAGTLPDTCIIEIVSSLLPVYFQLITVYYEGYYDLPEVQAAPNHEDWMSLFDDEHIAVLNNLLRDQLFLTAGAHNAEVSLILAQNLETYAKARSQIADTLELLEACGGTEKYREVMAAVNGAAASEVMEDAGDAFAQAAGNGREVLQKAVSAVAGA